MRHRRNLIAAAALAVLLLAHAARAQVGGCLYDVSLWTVPYPAGGAVQSVSYYPALKVLGVYRAGALVDLYVNVPLSVAQQFIPLSSADALYARIVVGRYSEMVLAETTACPLLNEATGQWLLAG